MYVKGGDNEFDAKGRANEIGQSWFPADLLGFQLPTTGTSQRSHRPYANTCTIAAATHTWVLITIACSIVCYRPILANGLLWPVDQHRVSALLSEVFLNWERLEHI